MCCYARRATANVMAYSRRNFLSPIRYCIEIFVVQVLMIARYHRHRIASAIFEVALSAQVTIMHQRNPLLGSAAAPAAVAARSLYRGRNAVPTVLQLVAACVVLYAPWHGALMWEAAAGSRRPTRTPPPPTPLLALASALLACAPPVNGLLYGVRSKLLRKTFQNYWRKQMSKSEMNQVTASSTLTHLQFENPLVHRWPNIDTHFKLYCNKQNGGGGNVDILNLRNRRNLEME